MNWARKIARNIGAGSYLKLWGKIPLKITGIEYPRDGTITFTLREPSWWKETGLPRSELKVKMRETQRPLTAREDEE